MNKLSISINLSQETINSGLQNGVNEFTNEYPYLSLIQPILLITLKNNYFHNIFQAKLGKLNDYDVQILTINYILKFFLHEFKKDFGITHFCNTQYDENIKFAVCHSKGALFSYKPTMNKNLNKVINHYIKIEKNLSTLQNENAEIIKYLNKNMKNKIEMNRTSFSPDRLIEIFTKSLKNEGADISNLTGYMYDLNWYLEHNMIKNDDYVRDYINSLGNIYNEYNDKNNKEFDVLKECEGEKLVEVDNEKVRVLQWIFDNSENTKGKTLKKLKNNRKEVSKSRNMEKKKFEENRQLLILKRSLCKHDEPQQIGEQLYILLKNRNGKNPMRLNNRHNLSYEQYCIINRINKNSPYSEKGKEIAIVLGTSAHSTSEIYKLKKLKNNFYRIFYSGFGGTTEFKPSLEFENFYRLDEVQKLIDYFKCINNYERVMKNQRVIKGHETKQYYVMELLFNYHKKSQSAKNDYNDFYNHKTSRGGMKNKKELEKMKMKNKKEVEKMKNKHKKEIEKLKNNHKKELNKLKKCN